MNNISKLFFIFLLTISMATFAGRRVMTEPDIKVPCSLSMEQVKLSIRAGLKTKKWIPLNKREGLIVGTLYIREHRLSMSFFYDQSLIKIRYKDSENLKYKVMEGKKYIHKNVNIWSRNIKIEIIRQLSGYC